MNRTDLERAVALRHVLSDRMSAGSCSGYLSEVVINSAPVPRKFGTIAEPWQWDLYTLPVQALESVAGVRENYTGPVSFWRTLPRGCDKTSMVGRLMNWCLAYSKRRLEMAVAAGDEDQAGFLTSSMKSELLLNPWLSSKVTMSRREATGPGGKLTVLAADAPSAYGGNYDVIVVDEITHWKKRALWDALYSGSAKRPGMVMMVITNAGVLGSWQDDERRAAQSNPSWEVIETPPYQQLASWMRPEAIDSIRQTLPKGLARRVLDNCWLDPAEESDFLTRTEILACEEFGRGLGLCYQTKGIRGRRYVASVDYGPKRDRTCLSVMHVSGDSVVLDKMDVWQGSPGHPIAISRVEEWIDQTNRDFNYPLLVVDPYQLEGTYQEFETRQEVMKFEARGGKRTYEMAENLRSLVINKRLLWYPGAGGLPVNGRMETLVDELCGLVLKIMPYGYRFDHTARFHDDRAVSVGMGALMALRMDPSGPGVLPTPVTSSDQDYFRKVYQGHRDWSRRGLWGTGR